MEQPRGKNTVVYSMWLLFLSDLHNPCILIAVPGLTVTITKGVPASLKGWNKTSDCLCSNFIVCCSLASSRLKGRSHTWKARQWIIMPHPPWAPMAARPEKDALCILYCSCMFPHDPGTPVTDGYECKNRASESWGVVHGFCQLRPAWQHTVGDVGNARLTVNRYCCFRCWERWRTARESLHGVLT